MASKEDARHRVLPPPPGSLDPRIARKVERILKAGETGQEQAVLEPDDVEEPEQVIKRIKDLRN